MLGDVYKSSWLFTTPFGDGDLVITMDYRMIVDNGTLSEPDICVELATEIGDAIIAGYMPLLGDDITSTRVDVFNRNQPTFQGFYPTGVAGSITASETGSIRSAPVVRKLTGLRGRSYNGRSFMMPPTEQDQNQGVLATAYRNSVEAWMNSIRVLTSVAAARQYQATVYSKTLLLDTLVTTFDIRDVMGSQRRRQEVFA